MASTLKVDNLQTQDGDSYNVVSWDTTAKTAAFTAVSGKGYFVDTTSAAITVTLPASPSAGDIVAISDYAGTAATNAITIARNGSNFEGRTFNGQIAINRQAVTLIYVDATQGWVPTSENDSSFEEPLFVTATGGTVTCCGNFKIHTFTTPGTFCVSCAGNPAGSNTVDYLVVAGGGAGGSLGGGGGGGGYRESCGTCYTSSPLGACVSALPVTAQGYPITVGAGGSSGVANAKGGDGSNSVFSTITSAGGGGGGGHATNSPGNDGGSGGGGGFPGGPTEGGSGNTPAVSPPQGSDGGGGQAANTYSGGGGGATEAGQTSPGSNGGRGGAGGTTNIPGSEISKSGGGGGGINGASPGAGGAGSPCGTGKAGIKGGGTPGPSADANTGGGGGGGSHTSSPPVPSKPGGSGGSGIVIIRYKYQ